MTALVSAEAAGSLTISKFLRSWCTLKVRWRTNGLAAHKGLDDDHWRAAVRTDKCRSHWFNRFVGAIGVGNCYRCHMQQLPCSRQVLFASVVGDQPVMANAVKPVGRTCSRKRRMNSCGSSVMVLCRVPPLSR